MNDSNNVNNVQNSNLNYDINANLDNNFNENINNNNNLNNKEENPKKVTSIIIIILVVIICGVGIGIGVLFLTGTLKKTPEMKLCKNINLQVENYNQNKITYNQFFENIMSDYNNYCTNEESNLCKTIKTYNDEKDELFEYQELEDCSKYNSEWIIDSKELCENMNEIKEYHNNNRENIADAQIREIKMLCDLADE